MHRVAVALVILVACAPLAPLTPHAPNAPVAPNALLVPFDFSNTMRLDYFHTGGPGGEVLALDRVVSDGRWSGSRTRLIDDTNLGKYFFEVIDPVSNRVMYSRGFSSIHGEWEITPEFRSTRRTFHESLRFPWPTMPIQIVLKKRDAQNMFVGLWSTDVDPGSVRKTQAIAQPVGTLWSHFESGPSDVKVDLLLISEGYSADQLPKFRADVRRLVNALFTLEPFKSRKSDFNIRALEIPGRPVAVEYNIFGLQRYMLTHNNGALRNVASVAPYDVLEILVNDSRYGGGGIFNHQSTVAAGNAQSPYVFVHELAHNLAGLGDEYVGNVTYETGAQPKVEPWEPNVTALLDPTQLKWRDLIEPGTPLPTPISYAGKVGAFEGAGYQAQGLYRPEAECIMSMKNLSSFCRVCQRGIARMIDMYTKP